MPLLCRSEQEGPPMDTQLNSKLHTQLDRQDGITSDMSQSFSLSMMLTTIAICVLAQQSAKIN